MAGLQHLFDIYSKQGKEFINDMFNKNLIVSEKPDGCLKYDTILETDDGLKTIQEICETQFTGKVKSYCIETNKVVWDSIIDHLIKEDSSKEWFEIETSCGKILNVTGNHKIYCSDLKIWKRVDELDGTELLLIK